MCSNIEDGTLDVMTKLEEEEANFQETCKKCNESKIAVKLKFKEAQCEKCFLNYVRHKFRASLGSTKIVGRGSRILVVYDGGPKSSVLLDMLRFAFFQDTYKKLHFEPHVLYIDDSVLFELTDDQRYTRLRRIGSLLNQFGFISYCTSLADPKHSLVSHNDYVEGIISDDAAKEFKLKLNSVTSHTSCDDYIRNIRTNIMRSIASQLNCNFVFTSEIESDLAKIFLTNITLGRGGSVSQHIAFCDTRGDVQIIRPIRNLDIVEVDHYIRFNQIDCLELNEVNIDGLFERSLQNVTKSFVDELQLNFPSTISTIFRTGDKMAGMESEKKTIEFDNCNFCGSNVSDEKSQTIRSLEYSRFVSENSFENRLKFVDDYCADSSKSTTMLCYGCRNIMKDISDRSCANLFL